MHEAFFCCGECGHGYCLTIEPIEETQLRPQSALVVASMEALAALRQAQVGSIDEPELNDTIKQLVQALKPWIKPTGGTT